MNSNTYIYFRLVFVTLTIKKHFCTHLPDQFLNQVKLNQVNFIITIGVIITNSSIITIINVFLKISLKTLHYHYY